MPPKRVERFDVIEGRVYDDQGDVVKQIADGKAKRAKATAEARMAIIALTGASLAFGVAALALFAGSMIIAATLGDSPGFALHFVASLIETGAFVALAITTYALRRWLEQR